MLQTLLRYLMFTSHKGMTFTPKTIDFPKQRVRHDIYSNSFISYKI
jgi:hypothetical protein